MISSSNLENAIKAKLQANGFTMSGMNADFIKAIAQAVADEIKQGEVIVASGSSAGTYKVT